MGKERISAFSDGVIAILITIMVLELKVPHGDDLAALGTQWPIFAAYALSYLNIGLIWNNHHHMFYVVEKVDGRVLWANLFLMFSLSLIPFATAWMGESHFAPLPVASYGVVMLGTALAWWLVARGLIAVNGGKDSKLAQALGRDRKTIVCVILNALAIPLALFGWVWISLASYLVVAAVWIIPDRRIESGLN